jgi:hypothetical protein
MVIHLDWVSRKITKSSVYERRELPLNPIFMALDGPERFGSLSKNVIIIRLLLEHLKA